MDPAFSLPYRRAVDVCWELTNLAAPCIQPGMELATYFSAQAHNNAWANHRLLQACAQLAPAEVSATRRGFFPSIIETLNHILTVDWFYVSALEGACVGPAAYEPEVPHGALSDLIPAQRAVDRRLIALCGRQTDDSLAEAVDLLRLDWVQRERRDRVLLHLFQHQIHHRGQVHAMLSETAVAPPQLDEFFLGDPREQALRADDFAALDFEEAAIWEEG